MVEDILLNDNMITDFTAYMGRHKQLYRSLAQMCKQELSSSIQYPVILDVGAGPGFLSFELKKEIQNATVISFDASIEMLQQLYFEKNALMHLVNGKAEYLPFHPMSIDVVISRFSLPYWSQPGKAFQEIACVLRRNGLLIVEMLNAEYPLWKKSLVKYQMKLKKASAHTIYYHLEAYTHAYKLTQVQTFLETNGFTLLRVEGRKSEWKYLLIAKKT